MNAPLDLPDPTVESTLTSASPRPAHTVLPVWMKSMPFDVSARLAVPDLDAKSSLASGRRVTMPDSSFRTAAVGRKNATLVNVSTAKWSAQRWCVVAARASYRGRQGESFTLAPEVANAWSTTSSLASLPPATNGGSVPAPKPPQPYKPNVSPIHCIWTKAVLASPLYSTGTNYLQERQWRTSALSSGTCPPRGA